VIPSAKSLKFSQLVDHVGTYLADAASMLIAIEEAGGQPSGLLADAAEIQRVVTERHGAQRARLGWTPDALRREYAILWDEIERIVRSRARSVAQPAVEEGLTILQRLLEQGEEMSCRALARAVSARADTDGTGAAQDIGDSRQSATAAVDSGA